MNAFLNGIEKKLKEGDKKAVTEMASMSEAFSRQHYVAIAEILKTHDASPQLCNAFAAFFRGDNPRFDAGRFLAACGVA